MTEPATRRDLRDLAEQVDVAVADAGTTAGGNSASGSPATTRLRAPDSQIAASDEGMTHVTHSRTLTGKTILMSGGSRGIGLRIALRAARDGANLVLLAKTDLPHPKLPGTIHTAVDEIRRVGGQAIAVVGDVRSDQDIARAVECARDRFGGIDIVVNNASVIDLSGSTLLTEKKYDLMQDVNVRGTFMLSRAAVPLLRESVNAHILSLSPPLNLSPHWLGAHTGYTLAKYGMTLVTLGLAAEFAEAQIAANTLWPATTIATAAVQFALGGDEMLRTSRTPQIYADAAYEVLTSPANEVSGRSLIVEDVLSAAGIVALDRYAATPGTPDSELTADFFLD